MQKMFKILPYISGSKPTSTNLLKVNKNQKNQQILLGKNIKTVVHPYATHREVYQITPSKSK